MYRLLGVLVILLATAGAMAQQQRQATPQEIALEASITALQANLTLYARQKEGELVEARKHAEDVDAWWRAAVKGVWP